ncbi:hypothetical protein BMETH_193_1 [methanotrophic bacterial endosymbiont of Bathymodiolus sp.]|nr:hypothetical protein BMETH_193_1 [methanotrophic bacterial endosymbiont of Bathymodiolus sp.]
MKKRLERQYFRASAKQDFDWILKSVLKIEAFFRSLIRPDRENIKQ